MSQIQRSGRINFSDTSLNIIEEGLNHARDANGYAGEKAWTRAFKRQVFARIVQQLNRIGWTCVLPPFNQVEKDRYSCIYEESRRQNRHCRKGDLQGLLSLSGRCIKFEMWQDVANVSNPNGGRYDFDKYERMPYLLRLEMERTRRRIRDYLCNVFDEYEFDPSSPTMGPNGITALEYAAHSRRTSGHYVPALDRARICNAGYDKSADGLPLENGTRVYAIGQKGLMVTGTAFYHLNGSWQIVTGRYGLTHVFHNQIWVENPGNLRVRRDKGERRTRLESELSKAIKAMNFERAAVLRDIIFPKSKQLYLVWHEEHMLYHRSGFSGYTPNSIDAGKFTADEVKEWDRKPNKIIAMECAA